MPIMVLARALSRALPTTRLNLVELPASVPDEFIEELVRAGNAADDLPEPRVVWVVATATKPELPQVHVDEAEVYRVGDRVFVYRHGDYVPRSSMTSSASPWLTATFPANPDNGLTIEHLASSVAAEVSTSWGSDASSDFHEAVNATLVALRNLVEHSGDGERPWAEVWWEATTRFSNRISVAYPALTGEGIPVRAAVAACASLPLGALATGDKPAALSSAEVDGLVNRFSSSDDRELTIARLQAAGASAGLLELDVGRIQASLAEGKHPVIALMDTSATSTAGRNETDVVTSTAAAWARVSSDDVRLCNTEGLGDVGLTVQLDGINLPRIASGAHLLPSSLAEWSPEATNWQAAVPLVISAALGTPVPRGSGTTTLQVKPVRLGSSLLVKWAADANIVTFEVTLTLRAKKTAAWPEKPIAILIKVPPHLSVALGASLSIPLLLGAPWGPTFVITDARDRIVVCSSPAPRGDDEDGTPDIKLKAPVRGAAVRVLTPRGGGAADSCVLNGQEMSLQVDRLWTAEDIDVADGTTLEYGLAVSSAAFGLRFSVEATAQPTEWLPIAAAFKGELPSRQASVPDELSIDLRGELEDHLRQLLDGWEGGTALPLQAWVLMAGVRDRPILPQPDDERVSWVGRPQGAIDLSPQDLKALRASGEYAAFCASLHALLSAVNEAEPGVTGGFWVSRWSLSRVSRAVIEGYLQAWSALVRISSGKQRAWAALPFSAIICQSSGKIEGALLSPLHPIRLAWAWSLECAFRDLRPDRSQEFPRLQQLVEGWNFPALVGDLRRGVTRVHHVAVPLWSGASREFIAWSGIADASSASARLPEVASGRKVPTGGSSGLTGGAVTGAIRDYLRVYPHASALTLELHASTQVARSVELDHAVIQELAEYSAGAAGLARLRYMQVFDSMNRLNDAPRAQDVLGTVYQKAGSVQRPFRWLRVDAAGPQVSAVDIRFVEDAHASVTIASAERAHGSSGRVPLRRAIPRDRQVEGGLGLHVSSGGGGWPAFEAALAVVEVAGTKPAVLVVEQTADGIGTDNERARWVVTGSAMTDPSALGAALGEGQLLWEWRPAAAARGEDDASLAGRPYVTVARVPGALVSSLRLLSGVDTDHRARALLGELGRRGVGLAALVGIGGYHADGALGFFLGFRLLDQALAVGSGPDRLSLILPIDAVHSLLEAVAQRRDVELGHRRADLLVMQLERLGDGKPRLTLMPVEIRCSNMRVHAAPSPFPSMQDKQVKEKVEQVEATYRLLGAVQDRLRAEDTLGAFTATALAALVEAGVAMVPDPIPLDIQSLVLQALASGSCDVRVSPGALLWFQKDASVDGSVAELQGPHAVMMVNPIANDRNFWGPLPESFLASVAATLHQQLGSGSVVSQDDNEASDDAVGNVALGLEASERSSTDDHTTPPENHSSSLPEKAAVTPATPMAVATEAPQQAQVVDSATQPATNSGGRGERWVTHGQAVEPEASLVGPSPGQTNTSGSTEMPMARPRAFLGTQRPAGEIFWDPLNPERPLNNAHIVIVGAAGSGKTQAIKAIMADVTALGVPALVLDFKDDYIDEPTRAACGARLWNVRDGLPFNPLALPSAGVKVVDVVYGLKGILASVYGLGDQQAATLKDALDQCYKAHGFKLQDAGKDGDLRPPPTLDDLKAVLATLPNSGPLRNRLGALFDFELFKPDTLGMQELLRGPGIIRFTQLPQEELKSATAGLLLRALYLHFQRIGHSNGKLRLLLVIDEAHRVANLDEVRLLVKEARAYGIGVVLSTQEATDLDDFAYSNAGTLIALKLAAAPQAERIAKMLARNQSEASGVADVLRSLPMFEALIRNDQYTPHRRVTTLPFFRRTYPASTVAT